MSLRHHAPSWTTPQPCLTDDEIVLSKVTSLTLSFRSIERIQNLLTLDSLEVLKLDNNLIKEITGLGS